ncbi:MAG: hypothetical protein J1E62_07745 [Lachnospiraceae bacterium]|nr:hypothetical protein [Lachnospiraceae bacterium]
MVGVFVYILVVLSGLHSEYFGYDWGGSLRILYEGYDRGMHEINLFEFILAYFMLAMSVHVIAGRVLRYQTLYTYILVRKKQKNTLYNALCTEILRILIGLTVGALLLEFILTGKITVLLIYYHVRYVLVLLVAAICLMSAMAAGNSITRRELLIDIGIMLGLIFIGRTNLSKVWTILILLSVIMLSILIIIKKVKREERL